jgi:hypothetical protein
MKYLLLISYFLLLSLFAIFSYVLANTNLFMLNADWFVATQNWLWQRLLPLQLERSIIYGGLILALFANYLLIIKNWAKSPIKNSKSFYLYLLILATPLILAYNSLSYDVFNYMFNAKMVIEYQADPHVKVALNFADDPWLRFMNNTHTPAPYGYTWTILSLLPYLLGFGKFLSIWLSFKLFALASLLLTVWILSKMQSKINLRSLAIFAFNPLVLIEVLVNAHNDLWMMSLALIAMYLWQHPVKKGSYLLSSLLMSISVMIKFASLVIWPFFLRFSHKILQNYYYEAMSLVMFLPLFTERSKQFLPWYLLWSLTFVPLLHNKMLRNFLLVMSFAAMLRYLPWMYYLPWMSYHLDSSNLETYQLYTTWIPAVIYLLSIVIFRIYKLTHAKK